MNDIKTGEWQSINGEWLRVVQTNAVTILVQNQKGEQFHINKKDIQMNETSKELRGETPAKPMELRTTIILGGRDINDYSTETLLDIVEGMAIEAERLSARKVKTSITKAMTERLTVDCAILVAWMEANRGGHD